MFFLTQQPAAQSLVPRQPAVSWVDGVVSGLGFLHNRSAEGRIKRELSELQRRITSKLQNTDNGFLIKVRAYSDNEGNIRIPEGQIILPIGFGADQVDALAAYSMRAHIVSRIPTRLREKSYYVWLETNSEGDSIQWVVPTPFVAKLERRSLREARRRVRLESFGRVFNSGELSNIKIYDSWLGTVENAKRQIKLDSDRERLQAMLKEFRSHEIKINSISMHYHRLKKIRTETAIISDILSFSEILSGIIGNSYTSHTVPGEYNHAQANSTDLLEDLRLYDSELQEAHRAYDDERNIVLSLNLTMINFYNNFGLDLPPGVREIDVKPLERSLLPRE